MNRNSLNRQIARATGESLRIIRQHGFQNLKICELIDQEPETLRRPLVVNWDELDRHRTAAIEPRPHRRCAIS